MIERTQRTISRIPFRAALSTRSIHLWFWPSLLVILVHTALVAARMLPIRTTEQTFVLHYSTALGIDRVGPWYFTFLPAAVGLAILIVNFFLALVFVKKNAILSTMIGLMTVTLEVGLLAAGSLIILLNV